MKQKEAQEKREKEKQERLAKALKANLMRRKQQIKERSVSKDD